jgi:Fic family protein
MREFNYKVIPKELVTPEIINMISEIHEYKGKLDLFFSTRSDILTPMLNIAMVQSMSSSNRIEGIISTDIRIKGIYAQKVEPKNREEYEIAGYRDVLSLIHESNDMMPPRPNILLQMHQYLFQFSQTNLGGKFKNTNNVIKEIKNGVARIRFEPVSSFETPLAIEHLTSEFIDAVNNQVIDPLFLIPMFILDFLCIHPFNDGNGRMSRLLTLLLLYRAGYIVGKYISLEMIIEKTKETYYDVLQESSINWHEGTNSYFPFVRYTLGVVLNAYKEFSNRIEFINDKSVSKPERIKKLFANSLEKLSKKTISEKFSDISISTIEATLKGLLKEDFIVKIGSGKNTTYFKKIK